MSDLRVSINFVLGGQKGNLKIDSTLLRINEKYKNFLHPTFFFTILIHVCLQQNALLLLLLLNLQLYAARKLRLNLR